MIKKIVLSILTLVTSSTFASDSLTEYISKEYKINHKTAETIVHAARNASKKHKVKFQTILAIIATESSFKVRSSSKKRSKGLMQIHPNSGIRLDNPFDISSNIDKGVELLKKYQKKFGEHKGIHAYNMGETNVRKGYFNFPYYVKVRKYELRFMGI